MRGPIIYRSFCHLPRIILVGLLLLLLNPLAQSQTDTSKTKKRINPFLQMGKDSVEIERLKESKDEQEKRDGKPKKDSVVVTQHATINSPTNYFMGEDKYLKVRNDDRRYDTFQVYDIKNLDKRHAVVGLLTNTLERGTRYEDKGDKGSKVEVSTGFLDKVDDDGKLIPGGKVSIAAIRFNDKIFVIIGEKDYRYLDGKKVVGNQQMVKELLKGKPVTELTFYYELQKAGIIETTMSYKQFSDLTLEQKFNILGPIATK